MPSWIPLSARLDTIPGISTIRDIGAEISSALQENIPLKNIYYQDEGEPANGGFYRLMFGRKPKKNITEAAVRAVREAATDIQTEAVAQEAVAENNV